MRTRLNVIGCIVAASLAIAERLPAQCNYEVTAILEAPVSCGILGPANTFATAINDHGVVTGYYDCLSNPRPFIWSEEMGFVLIPLPPGVSDATPADINNNNEIVGSMNEFSSGALPFHWNNDVWTELPLLPGFPEARAFSINEMSEIVGESFDAFSFEPFRALIWRDGKVSELSLPIGPQSSATDINNSSHITGWMGTSWIDDAIGFLTTDDIVVELPQKIGSTATTPAAINEQGVVAGFSVIQTKNGPIPRRSWLFENGKLTDLGALPSAPHSTVASDINDVNQIVGTAISPPPPASVSVPFFWQHGMIHDLRSFVIGGPGNLILRSADGINENGQIMGGALVGQKLVAVLLTPVDRPSGDVNYDCTVDEYDLIAVLEGWGPEKAGHPTDMVSSATFAPPGDGRVDGADLAVVLGNWSPMPHSSR